MPKVSVIIPNYNHAPYLRQRIRSVLDQTFQDMEVIILDDCSSDNSREIINEYKSNPRVQLAFNQANSGCVFKQWNKGLSMAGGEYIWIAESDDYAAPTFLEKLVGVLEADPKTGLVFCQSFCVLNGEARLAEERWFGPSAHLYKADFTAEGKEYVGRQMLLRNTIVNASSAVFRRKVAMEAGPADETFILNGDWLFWIKLLQRSNLAYVAEPLNYYRFHEQTVRRASETNGVMIEDTCRIALFVLKNFSVAPEDAGKIREWLGNWFLGAMISNGPPMPKARRQSLLRLMSELNPRAIRQLWFHRSGLQWLWLGCRRRALTLWKRFFHPMNGSTDISRG